VKISNKQKADEVRICQEDRKFRRAYEAMMQEKIGDPDDWIARLGDLISRYRRHRQSCQICKGEEQDDD
jgi:hypothetical protein